MATVSSPSSVDSVANIGETAGIVWRTLSDNGPMTLTKLIKQSGEPRDSVMQAIGWLAREGKVSIESNGRNRMISLQY